MFYSEEAGDLEQKILMIRITCLTVRRYPHRILGAIEMRSLMDVPSASQEKGKCRFCRLIRKDATYLPLARYPDCVCPSRYQNFSPPQDTARAAVACRRLRLVSLNCLTRTSGRIQKYFLHEHAKYRLESRLDPIANTRDSV